MKKTDQLARRLLAGGIALAMGLAVTHASAESVHQVVRVVQLEGSVQVLHRWQNLANRSPGGHLPSRDDNPDGAEVPCGHHDG